MLHSRNLYDALRSFWLRDYLDDIKQLNQRIKKSTAASAGLQDVPPSVLTGDPFTLPPGNCVVVLGKNPSFPGRPGDTEAARGEHRANDFERYCDRRKVFFSEDDPSGQYNWRHFSRLGNLLRAHIPAVVGDSPREAFRCSIGIFDVLPWWSKDTSGIDPRCLAADIEPMNRWREVLGIIMETLQPKLVIVHGAGFLDAAQTVLGTELQRLDFQSVSGYRGVAYSGQLSSRVPVLAHAQVTALGGPGTHDAYSALISAWKRAARDQCIAPD